MTAVRENDQSASQQCAAFPLRWNTRRIGIVSRDYGQVFPNRRRDFVYAAAECFRVLSDERCDAVLFSLFSVDVGRSRTELSGLVDRESSIRAVFYEEFKDGRVRKPVRQIVSLSQKGSWQRCVREQWFGLGAEVDDCMPDFVDEELPARVLGNACVLYCGEINGVRYRRSRRAIADEHGLLSAIPDHVSVILNPVHDRMSRFEMKLKRQFLSRKGRWVISVWNRGKGRESADPWQIFHNGREVLARRLDVGTNPKLSGIELAVVAVGKNK